MAELPVGKVWLASYPKSGNTWMRLLLSNLVAGLNDPQNINQLALNGAIASWRRPLEDQMLADSALLTPAELATARAILENEGLQEEDGEGRCVISKVHDAFQRLENGEPVLGRKARGVVYVARDPRDVAISLAAHSGSTIDWAINLLCDAEGRFGGREQFSHLLSDWSLHVRSWLDQDDTPLHLVLYEQLAEDPVATFRTVVDFLGGACTPEEIERAVRHADFAELRRQEAEHGFRERSGRANAPFFRQGRAGAWTEVLSADQVQRIEEAHGDVMIRLGYALTTRT